MVVSTYSVERGSVIIWLFIAIALFGLVGFAFLQGTRGNLSMITSEATKATGYRSQDCANAVALGMKRLKSRNCTGDNISLAENGTTGTGPSDGSCALFHPNGGGVKVCGADLSQYDTCSEGPLGAVCVDGAFYVGEIGGIRRYAAAANLPGLHALVPVAPAGTHNGSTSTTNGPGNTDVLLTFSNNDPSYAPVACRAMGAKWYVPAKDELHLLVANKASLNLTSHGFSATFHLHPTSTFVLGQVHVWGELIEGASYQSTSPNSGLVNNPRFRCFRR